MTREADKKSIVLRRLFLFFLNRDKSEALFMFYRQNCFDKIAVFTNLMLKRR